MNTYAEIILIGAKIFSDERRRHFSKELRELELDVFNEGRKVHPHFNNARKQKAEQKLEIFRKAYAKEFNAELTKLLERVGASE